MSDYQDFNEDGIDPWLALESAMNTVKLLDDEKQRLIKVVKVARSELEKWGWAERTSFTGSRHQENSVRFTIRVIDEALLPMTDPVP